MCQPILGSATFSTVQQCSQLVVTKVYSVRIPPPRVGTRTWRFKRVEALQALEKCEYVMYLGICYQVKSLGFHVARI